MSVESGEGSLTLGIAAAANILGDTGKLLLSVQKDFVFLALKDPVFHVQKIAEQFSCILKWGIKPHDEYRCTPDAPKKRSFLGVPKRAVVSIGATPGCNHVGNRKIARPKAAILPLATQNKKLAMK